MRVFGELIAQETRIPLPDGSEKLVRGFEGYNSPRDQFPDTEEGHAAWVERSRQLERRHDKAQAAVRGARRVGPAAAAATVMAVGGVVGISLADKPSDTTIDNSAGVPRVTATIAPKEHELPKPRQEVAQRPSMPQTYGEQALRNARLKASNEELSGELEHARRKLSATSEVNQRQADALNDARDQISSLQHTNDSLKADNSDKSSQLQSQGSIIEQQQKALDKKPKVKIVEKKVEVPSEPLCVVANPIAQERYLAPADSDQCAGPLLTDHGKPLDAQEIQKRLMDSVAKVIPTSPTELPTPTPTPDTPKPSARDNASVTPGHPAKAAPPQHETQAPTVTKRSWFRIASVNFLGKSHTERHGSKASWPNYGPRMRGMVARINRNHIDLIGAQELQTPQAKLYLKLQNQHGRHWESYPKVSAGNKGHRIENAILYDAHRITVVKGDYDHYPYFGGQPALGPRAELEVKSTGQDFELANFHDPANTSSHPHDEWYRVRAGRVHTKENNQALAAGDNVANVGDANSSVQPRMKFDHGLHGRWGLLTPNQITASGQMRLAWNVDPKQKHHHKRYRHVIDLIAVSKKFAVKNLHIVPTGHDSDHSMTVADLSLTPPPNAHVQTRFETSKARANRTGPNKSDTSSSTSYPDSRKMPASKKEWFKDVSDSLEGAIPYIRQRVAERKAGERDAIVFDADNTLVVSDKHYRSHRAEAIPAVKRIARIAVSKHVSVLVNTGRYNQAQIKDLHRQFDAVGINVKEIQGRHGTKETLSASKQRVRQHFINEGYRLIANIGNRPTDFAGKKNYGKAFHLPYYGGTGNGLS